MMMVITMTFQSAHAEDKKESRQQWAECQAKEIAAELKFDANTAQKFVETYCKYQTEMWNCRPRNGKIRHKKGEQLTDADAETILKGRFEHQRKINEIQEKYYGEYSKFLSQTQILKALDLEKKMFDRMFKQHMSRQKGKAGERNNK